MRSRCSGVRIASCWHNSTITSDYRLARRGPVRLENASRAALQIPRLAGREKPVLRLGFSPPDATWLTLVCFHSGLFTRRQYAQLHPMSADARSPPGPPPARRRTRPCERATLDTSVKVTHVHGHALGIRAVRRRRATLPFVLLRRLLCLDSPNTSPCRGSGQRES